MSEVSISGSTSSYLSYHHYTSERNALHNHQFLDLCSHGIHSHCRQLQQGFILLRVSPSTNRSVNLLLWLSEDRLINKLLSGNYHGLITEALNASDQPVTSAYMNDSVFYCLNNANTFGDIDFFKFCSNGCSNGNCK